MTEAWEPVGNVLGWNRAITIFRTISGAGIFLIDVVGMWILYTFGRELKLPQFRDSREMMILFAICTVSFGATHGSTLLVYWFGGYWYLVELLLLMWTLMISLRTVWFLRKLSLVRRG